jgi:hypothetical protein
MPAGRWVCSSWLYTVVHHRCLLQYGFFSFSPRNPNCHYNCNSTNFNGCTQMLTSIEEALAFGELMKIFNSYKPCIHTITLYKWWWHSRSQTPPYILTKKKQVKKLLKIYPTQGSTNNQKDTKSKGNNITWKQYHMETKSHGSWRTPKFLVEPT